MTWVGEETESPKDRAKDRAPTERTLRQGFFQKKEAKQTMGRVLKTPPLLLKNYFFKIFKIRF